MEQQTRKLEKTEYNTEDIKISKKVYSPTQAACGGLGGPVGAIYFLYSNFAALGMQDYKNKTLTYGGAITIALIFLILVLPENFPSFPFTIFYVAIAKVVATKYQMTKEAIIESEDYDFHSNWRVFGITMLCSIGSFIVVAVPIFLLVMGDAI